VSDAPRPEQAPDDRPQDAAAGPRPAPEHAPTPDEAPAPDALGAWPDRVEEAGAMPAERDPAVEGDAGEEVDPVVPEPEEDPRSREELLAALREAEVTRDEYLDDVRRGRAEFENFRRRTMREGATQREAGRAEVLEGLLDVLDDLDRTLQAAGDSQDETLAKGVQLVAEKLMHSLKAAGLERIEATGEPFDPNHHEAVQQTESEEPRDEPAVAQVLRPGYRLGDRVLRAAMVVVEQ
jgi:molecular chaperone GrpE